MCFCTPNRRTPFCPDCNQAMFLRIKELIEQVAALTKDKKSALLNYIDADEQLAMMTEERDKMFADLAAAQAQIAQLRGALEKIAEVCNGYDLEAGWACRHAMEALSTPTDTAALDARLKDERERCAKEAWMAASSDCEDRVAAAIRSMK